MNSLLAIGLGVVVLAAIGAALGCGAWLWIEDWFRLPDEDDST